ncbi:DNA adenine methylase [Xanthomonas albilineans]|uniref:DNA adenine methylase n=1 Tax=Xanthomonas albilineans TaxID=29447 RepID=UPI0027D94189|nr:DNA adenine methylase [Xanthomonas albilineans]
MTKPIIPWPGSKRRLIRHLYTHFPAHECYVEAFAGGAAALLMRPMPAPVEVLNDINGDLVRLYRCVQHHLDEFVRQFRWSLVSRKMFEWAQLQHPETLTDIQRAARFYYLQKLAFGGKVTGQSFGYTTTVGGLKLNLLRIEEELSAVHIRLANVIVEHLPWHDCLQRYDRSGTLFYLDPPYWQTEGYGVDFPWAEYERLANMMRNMQGRAILSINDHPDIRALFADMTHVPLQICYSIGRDRGGESFGELIIKNWDDKQASLL